MLRLYRVAFLAVLLLTGSRVLSAQAPTWTDYTPSGAGPMVNGNTPIYDAVSNKLVFFGGLASNGSCCTNDSWILANANGSGSTPTWQKLAPVGTLPSARLGHSA